MNVCRNVEHRGQENRSQSLVIIILVKDVIIVEVTFRLW